MKLHFTLFFVFIFASSYACLWDRDTYAMEKQRFPNAYELITGNFLRHSTAYYKWRISELQPQIDNGLKDPKIYDDLAVAYSKLHMDKKAIEIMIEKEKFAPNLYETYANLGTFYIHDGQFEEGLIYIDKAIAINPDAHFGREIYQRYLVEFVILQKKKKLKTDNFYDFLVLKYNEKYKKNERNLNVDEVKKATKGILGMMRFGNYNSPVLLNALGDVLLNEEYNMESNAVRLGGMAYLAAEIYAKKEISLELKEMLKIRLSMQQKEINKYEDLLKELNKGIDNGIKAYGKIEENETKWSEENKNLDEIFEEVFYNNDIFKQNEQNIQKTTQKVIKPKTNYFLYSIVIIFVFLILIGVYFLMRKKM